MARKGGISGVALGFGALGFYLVYAGIRDVAFLPGLRSLLRGEQPESRSSGDPYQPDRGSGNRDLGEVDINPFGGPTANDNVSAGLVGNAKMAYSQFRQIYPNMTIHGRGSRPGPSDHPIGKALDLMTTQSMIANRIIQVFRTQPGAKYWIWNRQIASAERGWTPRPYNGYSPHTDHVHLSYY